MGDGCSALAVYDQENEKAYLLHCPVPEVEEFNSEEIVGKAFSRFFYENVESVGSSDYYIVTSFHDIDDYLDNELTDPSKKAILGSYETAELTVNPPQQPDINVRIREKEVAHTATSQDKYSSDRKTAT
ncbi:MAG: hypothetical protein ABEK16_03830 [Candidatus Nanohalobium sp.]